MNYSNHQLHFIYLDCVILFYNYKVDLMDICFYCLAMVLISTLVGALLSYLFFRSGSRKVLEERDELIRVSELSQTKFNKTIDEYNIYKSKATQRIEDGEVEINRLNKLNLSLSKIGVHSSSNFSLNSLSSSTPTNFSLIIIFFKEFLKSSQFSCLKSIFKIFKSPGKVEIIK